MNVVTIGCSIFLSIFSTAIMSYIAMATPIGPWIAPTLVLLASLIAQSVAAIYRQHIIAHSVIAGSIGGILATACGFSFPTLYFLDAQLFNAWLSHPLYFISIMFFLSFSAGWLGLWVANNIQDRVLENRSMPFPIAQLTYSMIVDSNAIKRSYELVVGIISSIIFGILQAGLWGMKKLIPRAVSLIHAMQFAYVHIPSVSLDLDIMPTLLAIGFVTGHVIALPLLTGLISRICILNPINQLMFPQLDSMEFLLAFCSGMVLIGACSDVIKLPKQCLHACRMLFKNGFTQKRIDTKNLSFIQCAEFVALLLMQGIFLWHVGFSIFAQLFILVGTVLCAYQITLIAGKIGLAPLGRFATFVMIPAMVLFPLSSVQIVFVATIVEICGGVAVDVLVGRKIGILAEIDKKRVRHVQYLGLFVSSLTVGIIFLLLIRYFGLGSAQLFAYKAQARSLLINAKQFNYYVLLIGGLFGYLLKKIRINPGLALGGLLMPFNISLGLIIGGSWALLATDKERWYPLWSGIFAGNSIWLICNALR